MAERAVVNASPLIFLSRAGLLDLLQLLSPEIVVPEIVGLFQDSELLTKNWERQHLVS